MGEGARLGLALPVSSGMRGGMGGWKVEGAAPSADSGAALGASQGSLPGADGFMTCR